MSVFAFRMRALGAAVVAAIGARTAGAQLTGSVVIPTTVALEAITPPGIVSRDGHVVVVSADLVVGANARFDVVMRPLSGFDVLARKGITMSVLTMPDNSMMVDGSKPVTLTRHQRGPGRVSRMFYRFESPNEISDRDIDLGIEYDAVISSNSGVALRVLSEQRITLTGQPARTRSVGGRGG